MLWEGRLRRKGREDWPVRFHAPDDAQSVRLKVQERYGQDPDAVSVRLDDWSSGECKPLVIKIEHGEDMQPDNRPDLSAAKKKCLAFESEIASIGRNRVAKAAEYGRYLNGLYEQHFTVGGAYWKEWVPTIESWGLNRQTLDNYRLLGAESENMPTFGKLSSLTDAYAAARKVKTQRQAAAARAKAEADAKEAARRAAEAREAEETRREADAEAGRAAQEAREAGEAAERERLEQEAAAKAETARRAEAVATEAAAKADTADSKAERSAATADDREARTQPRPGHSERYKRTKRAMDLLLQDSPDNVSSLNEDELEGYGGFVFAIMRYAEASLRVVSKAFVKPDPGALVAHETASDDTQVGSTFTDEPQEAMRLYNETARSLGLSVARVLTSTRRSQLKQRLRECGGIEGWRVALEKLAETPFCLGDNDRGWKADFGFLLQQKTFTRLMEGGYGHSRTQSRSMTAAQVARQRREAREGTL